MRNDDHHTRRSLLRGAAWVGAGLVASPALAVMPIYAPAWKSDPFGLGIASGAPSRDGFVLWTRLAPDPAAPDAGMSGDSVPVAYEIASDEAMRHVVRRGAATADASYGWSVHEEVHGLKPGRPYWYRFRSGGAQSPIGRAATLPAPGTQKLRFAYFSCSDYEHGYFSAYRHAAAEAPEFAVFLGDYIYEYIETQRPTVRKHSGGIEPRTLAEYRARYTQYRLDPDLRAIHAACPSLVTWDDHEVQNDYADKWSEGFADPIDFLTRRAAAYRAFYEFMPVKPVFSEPSGSAMRVYDRYSFGDLMDMHIIDGRQYRSREACYRKPDKGGGHVETAKSCPELFDETRSMIGQAQEAWLYDGLAKSKSHWNVIANDVMMARLRTPVPGGGFGYWTDDWDGYPPARARLLRHIHETRPRNPVAITGDIHSFWANDLKLDFDDPNSPTVATELVGTSISSGGPPHDQFVKFLGANPHIKFFDSRKRGYVSVELTRKQMSARYQAVSDVADPSATVATLASFVVENGKAGAVRA